jgi:hypothetical protein
MPRSKAAISSQRVENNPFHLGIATRFTQLFTRTSLIRWLKVRGVKIYRGFPERLHHRVPYWVEPGALFHIRIALGSRERTKGANKTATRPRNFGFRKILRSQGTMAHHAFPFNARSFARIAIFCARSIDERCDRSMETVSRANQSCLVAGRILRSRLRADERSTQLLAKMNYVRQNPVAAGLCAKAEAWPWVIDPFAD